MSSHATFEALESRQLASVSLNTELIVNGGAEAGQATTDAANAVAIPGWEPSGVFSVVKYGSPGFLDAATGAAGRGSNFFSGGRIGPPGQPALLPSATQTIAVSSLANDIDAGRIRFDFSGDLGGFGKEKDTMAISFEFLNAKGQVLDIYKRAGPTPQERGNKPGYRNYGATGKVPVGTRDILVRLTATREFGVVADGYADNLSLRLSSSAPAGTGLVSGTVFNDRNGNGKRNGNDPALAGVTVFADIDNDRRFDANEPTVLTDANGAYTLPNVRAGKVVVRTIAPVGFRATPSSRTVNVTDGLTTTDVRLGLSQTALITGKVSWDDGEPFSGGAVYIDTNGNKRLDEGEQSVETNDAGEFRITVPRGQHTVRVHDVEGARPMKVKVAKGQTSGGHVMTVPPQ